MIDELELRKLATHDSLTGAMTRRAFAAEAAKDIAIARDRGTDLSCLVFDVDHFKSINDRYGHAAGDRVLQAVVEICQHELRAADKIGRMGGEEFAILLPECDFEKASAMAERLRKTFANTLRRIASVNTEVTASFGVTSIHSSDEGIEALIDRADHALYRAKHMGRNCVQGVRLDSADRCVSIKVA